MTTPRAATDPSTRRVAAMTALGALSACMCTFTGILAIALVADAAAPKPTAAKTTPPTKTTRTAPTAPTAPTAKVPNPPAAAPSRARKTKGKTKGKTKRAGAAKAKQRGARKKPKSPHRRSTKKKPGAKARPPKPRVNSRKNPGKAAFMATQCAICHTVIARGIGKKRGPGDAPGSPPDLSTVGRRYTAQSMRAWLRGIPNIRGKRHPFPFPGTERQLQDLIAWLLTLR